ncbi:MAG: carboxypeptidase M32 [Candidatus Hadarchaeia archaeon]
MSDTENAYEELLEKIRKIRSVSEAQGVLRWDQQVMMPDAGTFSRSRQMSALSSIYHDLLTNEKIGELLDEIDEEELMDPEKAVVREIKREYKRATSVPNSLVAEITKTSSEAFQKWKKAKEKDEFGKFKPLLEKMVELKREYAREIDPEAPPYSVLFQDYEPYLGLDVAEKILTQLRKDLIPFIQRIREANIDFNDNLFSGGFPPESQESFARGLLDDLGFSWDRGRLDKSPHPFTMGTQFDTRITTRFHDDFLNGLFSTIHEFGHALYGLNLPKDEEIYGTPLAESREMTVHESQSRLWENHIGRSKPFWRYLLPKVKEEFSGFDSTLEEAYKVVNKVKEDNPVRIQADELTYHLHIVLRFEMEMDLIEGDISIGDVPEVWNEKMERYLGIRPQSDAVGCLQDVHWSNGYIGYFPNYSLGSVLSAQFFETLRKEIDNIDGRIEEGEFEVIREWLRDNIHKHGKIYRTDELIRAITGEGLKSDYFLDYAMDKYKRIYNL